jgi:hypothetical protein
MVEMFEVVVKTKNHLIGVMFPEISNGSICNKSLLNS